MASNGIYKMVVLGCGGVGKSSLIIRLITDNFLEEYNPTIEDSYQKNATVDGTSAVLDILDTAGQVEFSAMQDQWIREGKGFLLVYSVTDMVSFEEVAEFREKIFKIKNSKKFPIVLIGNKCDVKQQQRQVTEAQGLRQANEWNCPFFETSAKNKFNTVECFYEVVREIRKNDEELSSKPVASKSGIWKFCSIL